MRFLRVNMHRCIGAIAPVCSAGEACIVMPSLYWGVGMAFGAECQNEDLRVHTR